MGEVAQDEDKDDDKEDLWLGESGGARPGGGAEITSGETLPVLIIGHGERRGEGGANTSVGDSCDPPLLGPLVDCEECDGGEAPSHPGGG